MCAEATSGLPSLWKQFFTEIDGALTEPLDAVCSLFCSTVSANGPDRPCGTSVMWVRAGCVQWPRLRPRLPRLEERAGRLRANRHTS